MTQQAKKRANERLRKALKAEKRLNKLQREFVSMVSHEFRTPLAIIDSSAQKIIRQYDNRFNAGLSKRTDKIRSCVLRMIKLIESVLSASRFDSGKINFLPHKCDLRKILLNICLEQTEINPEHQIQTELDSLPQEYFGDPVLLEHIFSNLISNGIKYSPNNKKIKIRGYLEGAAVVVKVRDHGVGIPQNELPLLFEKFFRARTSAGIAGTGLGLYMAKQFIELHGGEIQINSSEGKGATFTVRLPISTNNNNRKIQEPKKCP